MTGAPHDPDRVESLVNHMFSQVLTEPERAELLGWIRDWEAANPDVDAAHRITGWIDVAYAYHSRRHGLPTTAPAESTWGWIPSPSY